MVMEIGEKVAISICGRGGSQRGLSEVLSNAPDVQKDLTLFDQILQAMGDTAQPLEIEILDQPSLFASITEEKILLGKKVLMAEGQLLKALNKAWLLQVNSSFSQNPLMLEVFSDLLLAAEKGGLDLFQPVSGKTARYIEGENPVRELSQLELCQGPWAPMSQFGFCQSLLEMRASTGTAQVAALRVAAVISKYSIRSFLGGRLWEKFKQKSVSERVSTLQRMLERIRGASFAPVEGTLSSNEWADFAKTQMKFVSDD